MGQARGRKRRRFLITDILVLGFVGLLTLSSLWQDIERLPLWMLSSAACVAQTVALWWRRSRPVEITAIALVTGLIIMVVDPDTFLPLGALLALGSLAAARPPRISLPGLALVLGLAGLNYFYTTWQEASFGLAFPVVAWALGEVVRNRRRAIDEAARRAAGEEQARIARELHDVIAHSVSVIVVQAAAANDIFDSHPDQARNALRTIEESGRDALGELRRLLAAVRPDPQAVDHAPQPGLGRLDELAQPLRSMGLEVTVANNTADSGVTVPQGVDLSAYRIVQEALTNVLRHANARLVTVTVHASKTELTIEVLDDGRGDPSGKSLGSGRGIAGMTERAVTLGGTLSAEPLAHGGFRIFASLPMEAPS